MTKNQRAEETQARRGSVFNAPNALSLYRIAAAPVILYGIFSGHRMLFAWLIIISLGTDALDGFIARHWKLETAIGVKFDSIGDLATDFLTLFGLLVFEQPFVRSHILPISLLFGFYLVSQVLSLLRFHRLVSLHLYTSKLTNILLAVFFTAYFLVTYVPALFYAMIVVGILGAIEEIAVLCFLREHRENARGLYWVLKAGD
ncbi:MAG: CDP-alcohol phosphatidyltransferase family protein [Desulfobulbaceae bacterium]|nr:CDP-alcohol phosphatidyltransferase family protein [Desulfobulbaceae bacterium]